jgi:hypothetical protein
MWMLVPAKKPLENLGSITCVLSVYVGSMSLCVSVCTLHRAS